MAAKRYQWKIWLRPNPLSRDTDKNYMAIVSTIKKTYTAEDIAAQIIASGSELKYETILSILNRSNDIVCEMLQNGGSVQTGLCRLSPRVSGPWSDKKLTFDPAAHKITLDIQPSLTLRKALRTVGVEVLDVRGSGSVIRMVTDISTNRTDGIITPGDDILIKGTKIRIHPEDDDRLGVFFINSAGEQVKVIHRFTKNDPGTVIARVPALPPGIYTLQIVTRYTTGRSPLKDKRTIEYKELLTIH